MKKDGILTSEKPILGFRSADLLGILIMIIPFVISIKWHGETTIWFRTKEVSILPHGIPAFLAVVFYTALIVRFNFFKASNLAQALVSAVRTFLNCWVLASFLTIAIPKQDNNGIIDFLKDPQGTIVFFAIVLTWLGIKIVAGYSWILFIITGWRNVVIVNGEMGTLGAVFILTIAISLFLQIKDLSLAKGFLQDFKVGTEPVKRSINSAVSDAEKRVFVVNNYVRKNIPDLNATPPSASPIPAEAKIARSTGTNQNVKIDLKSLDVNGDGVVDGRDFEVLRKK